MTIIGQTIKDGDVISILIKVKILQNKWILVLNRDIIEGEIYTLIDNVKE